MAKPPISEPPKRKTVKGAADTRAPYEPVETEMAEIGAIKALIEGSASEYQQKLFVGWLKRATAVGEMSYRPSERDTAFAEGKRFVGLQFFTLAKTVSPQQP